MQKIRSFIALPLNSEIQDSAGILVDRLRDSDTNVRWVETETLHLTLKYLGDVDNREIHDVCKVLRKCCENIQPFSLHIEGAGASPSVEKARVIWANVKDEDEALCPLAEKIDEGMGSLGFKREFRDYQPHLTLGRFKKGCRPKESFVEELQRNREFELGTIQCEEVCLYASFLDREGPTYNVMDRIELT